MATLLEALSVLTMVSRVDSERATLGPAPLIARMRTESRRRRDRTSDERQRLKRTIAWIDSRLPGGASCYRRALLEIALDRGAAQEPFYMGLTAAGGPKSGHAWLGSDPDSVLHYDTVIAL
jgi:hypothetical protein